MSNIRLFIHPTLSAIKFLVDLSVPVVTLFRGFCVLGRIKKLSLNCSELMYAVLFAFSTQCNHLELTSPTSPSCIYKNASVLHQRKKKGWKKVIPMFPHLTLCLCVHLINRSSEDVQVFLPF